MKRLLRKADLQSLSATIAETEKSTAGEIRLVIRHKRHWRERKLQVHEIAVNEFHRLGMHHTKHRSGVLIMLILAERKFHIVADEGIHAKVDEGTWDRIASEMSGSFREGQYVRGLQEAIGGVGRVLAMHFPRLPDDKNELPNDIVEEH